MNPVPDRKTFIRTIRKVIYDDLYDTLKDKNTHFYKIIDSCVRLMYEDNWYKGEKAFFSKNKGLPKLFIIFQFYLEYTYFNIINSYKKDLFLKHVF